MFETDNISPASRQGYFFGLPLLELTLSFIIFFVLASLFFLPLLDFDRILVGPDLAIFFIPFRQLWVEQVLQGNFPLWDPFMSSGTPLFATLQGAVLYPFSIFYLLLDFFQAFNLIFIMHYALAGFSMYWLIRASSCSRMGAAIGALVFMFGGYLFSVRFYLSTLYPAAWTPILLLCFFAGWLRQDKRYAVAAALTSTIMFFAGGVETCYQIFAWLTLFSFLPVILFPKSELPDFKNRMVYLGIFFVFFLGFSAIQMFPFWELFSSSFRAGPVEFTKVTRWSMRLQDWLQFFFLDPHGYITFHDPRIKTQVWLQTQYVGATTLMLAGLFFSKGGTRVFCFALVMVISWALALGESSGLYRLFFEYLPFFGKFRYPVKFILPFVIVIAISAAYGWDALTTSKNRLTLKNIFLGISTVLMIVFGLIDVFKSELVGWLLSNGYSPPFYNVPKINLGNFQRLLGFTSLFSFFIFLFFRKENKNTRYLAGAFLIFFMDIFFSSQGNYRTIPREVFKSISPTTRFLLNQNNLTRVYVTSAAESGWGKVKNFQIFKGIGFAGNKFPVEFRNMAGVYQINGWNVIRKKHLINFAKHLNHLPLKERLNMLRMSNARYIVDSGLESLKNLPIAFEEPPEYRKELEKNNEHPPPPLRVYENPGYLERAFLSGNCKAVPDGPQLKDALLNSKWDPEQWVLLPESPPDLPCALPGVEAKKGEGTVQITHWKSEEGKNDLAPGEYRMQVDSARKQFLVLSDSYYPGWEAFIDGEQVKIHRANQAFRAIVMPAGKHTVEFRYRPKSFLYGTWISGVSLIAGLFFVVASTRGKPDTDEV